MYKGMWCIGQKKNKKKTFLYTAYREASLRAATYVGATNEHNSCVRRTLQWFDYFTTSAHAVLHNRVVLLGTTAKLRLATINFAVSVRLSVHMELGSY